MNVHLLANLNPCKNYSNSLLDHSDVVITRRGINIWNSKFKSQYSRKSLTSWHHVYKPRLTYRLNTRKTKTIILRKCNETENFKRRIIEWRFFFTQSHNCNRTRVSPYLHFNQPKYKRTLFCLVFQCDILDLDDLSKQSPMKWSQ